MKKLIDNTGLNRVFKVLDSTSSQPIKKIDFIAFLQFIENILFSDSISISIFEREDSLENTMKIISKIEKFGLADYKNKFINTIDFTDEQYKSACNKAISNIIEDLTLLTVSKLNNNAYLATEASKPSVFLDSVLEKWITKDFDIVERHEIVKKPLLNKSRDAYDYILSFDENLYDLFKDKFKPSMLKNVPQSALYLDVIFLAAINQSLTLLDNNKSKLVYNPSPQRALIIKDLENDFRVEIEKKIQNRVVARRGSFPSKFLNSLSKHERLPLPFFALYFLNKRKERINSPFSMIDQAIYLRENSEEVDTIRAWLKKWDSIYVQQDKKKKDRAYQELEYLERKLIKPPVKYSFLSWFKFGNITVDGLNQKIKFQVNEELAYDIFQEFLLRHNRNRIFLSMINEFEFDDTIGAELLFMINRRIIN